MLMDSLKETIKVLPVRGKKYVLVYAGRKRGHVTYDVLNPLGEEMLRSATFEEAKECCELHYVSTTKFARRVSPVRVKKVRLGSLKRLDYGNDAHTDRTNLGDYAQFSFDATDEEFNFERFTRNNL